MRGQGDFDIPSLKYVSKENLRKQMPYAKVTDLQAIFFSDLVLSQMAIPAAIIAPTKKNIIMKSISQTFQPLFTELSI